MTEFKKISNMVELTNGANRLIPTYILHKSETEMVKSLGMDLIDKYDNAENPKFLALARMIAFQHLPLNLIYAINVFYLRDIGIEKGREAILIKNLWNTSGFPNTPDEWQVKTKEQQDATKGIEFINALILSLHWCPVSFDEQRGGGLYHDMIPNEKDEVKQVGTGSREALVIHTEDVPLSNSADVMSLFNCRNNEKCESILSFVSDWNISKELKDSLSKPQFIFPPDPNLLREGVEYDRTMKPILFGNAERPSIRLAVVDIFDNDVELSEEAMRSLHEIDNISKENVIRFTMEAGDFLLFSNRRALHGRGSFEPHYDSGLKRWVLRMMAVEGLGKSSGYRSFVNPYKITERSVR